MVLSWVKQSSVRRTWIVRDGDELWSRGESVSQDLRFGVVMCSVECAVPQWSLMRHASCSASVCKIARGVGRWSGCPFFLCAKQSFVMSTPENVSDNRQTTHRSTVSSTLVHRFSWGHDPFHTLLAKRSALPRVGLSLPKSALFAFEDTALICRAKTSSLPRS